MRSMVCLRFRTRDMNFPVIARLPPKGPPHASLNSQILRYVPAHRVRAWLSVVDDGMRAVIQRVREASVVVSEQCVGQVGAGLLILLGVGPEDTEAECRWLVHKVSQLRIFEDSDGKMNLSLLESGGEALVVSQFTLYACTRKGRRPSFNGAAHPGHAEPMYERFCALLEQSGVSRVATGVFGAHMDVRLLNDGPVTLIVDTP